MKNYIWIVLLVALIMVTASYRIALAEEAKGEVKCTQSMDITEPKFGSTADVGVPVKFSDLGCAFVFRKTACATEQMHFDNSATAMDYYTGEPVKMEAASFVMDEKLATPLGYGIAAFKDKASAERYVSESGRGKIYTYSELNDMKLTRQAQ